MSGHLKRKRPREDDLEVLEERIIRVEAQLALFAAGRNESDDKPDDTVPKLKLPLRSLRPCLFDEHDDSARATPSFSAFPKTSTAELPPTIPGWLKQAFDACADDVSDEAIPAWNFHNEQECKLKVVVSNLRKKRQVLDKAHTRLVAAFDNLTSEDKTKVEESYRVSFRNFTLYARAFLINKVTTTFDQAWAHACAKHQKGVDEFIRADTICDDSFIEREQRFNEHSTKYLQKFQWVNPWIMVEDSHTIKTEESGK
ncbi:hypothetical protein N7532_007307 [Penicillium argentinense]|uniref:Uncharacterized protein n=1 Tax=Penicillium argentinense TaxID=1131581 RepID=A0A9W9F7E9_9EURO|nr:uncharacterized protein N7532_007307 [Penicillium argentinense]KAJ5095016.1 hypothetical protein N7532_007307 [Penicillium argentinense]